MNNFEIFFKIEQIYCIFTNINLELFLYNYKTTQLTLVSDTPTVKKRYILCYYHFVM